MTPPRIGMIAPEVCCVQLEHDCGADIDITLDEQRNHWRVPASCEGCNKPLPLAEWVTRAKHALSNYDPTDQEMRMAGLIP